MFTDNDQGETLILAVVVDGPASHVRKVEIQSDLKDEKIVLYLRTGDGYAMDGLMQQNYTHGVLPIARCNQECKSDGWISIGKKKVYPKESGWWTSINPLAEIQCIMVTYKGCWQAIYIRERLSAEYMRITLHKVVLVGIEKMAVTQLWLLAKETYRERIPFWTLPIQQVQVEEERMGCWLAKQRV